MAEVTVKFNMNMGEGEEPREMFGTAEIKGIEEFNGVVDRIVRRFHAKNAPADKIEAAVKFAAHCYEDIDTLVTVNPFAPLEGKPAIDVSAESFVNVFRANLKALYARKIIRKSFGGPQWIEDEAVVYFLGLDALFE